MNNARNYFLRLGLCLSVALLVAFYLAVPASVDAQSVPSSPPGYSYVTPVYNSIDPYAYVTPYLASHLWDEAQMVNLVGISNYLHTSDWWYKTNSAAQRDYWFFQVWSNAWVNNWHQGFNHTNFFLNVTNWYPALLTNTSLLLSNAIAANTNAFTNWAAFNSEFVGPAISNWYPTLVSNSVVMTNLLGQIGQAFTNLGSLVNLTNLNFSGFTNLSGISSNMGALASLSELTNVSGLWPTFNSMNTNLGGINELQRLTMMPLFTIVSSNIQGLKADMDKQVSYITVNSNFLKLLSDKNLSVSNYIVVTNINTNTFTLTNAVSVSNQFSLDAATSNNIAYLKDTVAVGFAGHTPPTNYGSFSELGTNAEGITNFMGSFVTGLTGQLSTVSRTWAPEGDLSNLVFTAIKLPNGEPITLNFNFLAIGLVADWAPRIRALVTFTLAFGFFWWLLEETKQHWLTVTANQQIGVIDVQGWGFSTNWATAAVVVPLIAGLVALYPAAVIFNTTVGSLMGFTIYDWVLNPLLPLVDGMPVAQAFLKMLDGILPLGLIVYTAIGYLCLGWVFMGLVFLITGAVKVIPR